MADDILFMLEMKSVNPDNLHSVFIGNLPGLKLKKMNINQNCIQYQIKKN